MSFIILITLTNIGPSAETIRVKYESILPAAESKVAKSLVFVTTYIRTVI